MFLKTQNVMLIASLLKKFSKDLPIKEGKRA